MVAGGIPVAVIQSIIFLVAISWNLFIITVYILKRQLLKEPANLLLFTLAIVDVLICLIIVPGPIIVSITREFVLGNTDEIRCAVCDTQGFFFIFLTTLSIHLLAMLSIDRCILLSNPMRYPRYRKAWLWALFILLVWVLCVVLAILPVFRFGQWEFNRNFGLCLPRWLPARNFSYMAGVVMLEGLIPFVIILFTNIWTFKIIHLFLRRRRNRKRESQMFLKGGGMGSQQEFQNREQQQQLVRVFGALLIATIIAWVPLMIVQIVLIGTNGKGVPDWIYMVGWFFYLVSPLVHPILESLFVKELRTRINKAKTTIRRASMSVIKMTSRSTIKDIPELPEVTPCASTKSSRAFSFSSHIHKSEKKTDSLNGSIRDDSPNDEDDNVFSPSKVRFSVI